MSKQYTNDKDVPLLFIAWLMNDEYDYSSKEKYISATSLMRPVKETILSQRVDPDLIQVIDIAQLAPSVLGNAIHDTVERVWRDDRLRTKALLRFGYSEEDIKHILINPTAKEIQENPEHITLYFEQRKEKKVRGYTIGGKFDAILSGVLHDIKSTSAYAWANDSRALDYILQGSIYRWLNPELVTEDFIRICYFFTDWSKSGTSNPDYPDARVKYRDYPLMSIADTEAWVNDRIRQIHELRDADESVIPNCTDEEVWLAKQTFRYFSDPAKVEGRATRVFSTHEEAMDHWTKAGKGIVISPIPVANKCRDYCNAYSVCTQKDSYALKED